jgi:predicted transcriptional regulator
MPGPKRSRIQRERDRAVIAELYLKGWSQTRIGEYLELNQSQVSRELSKIKATWKAESMRDFDLHLLEQLRRLSMVETEYWEGWQRSQTTKELSLQERLTEAATRGDGRTKVQRRTEARIGDPRFLEGLLKCVQERSKLLDLYPTNSAPASNSNAIAPGLSPDAVQLIRAQILGVQSPHGIPG